MDRRLFLKLVSVLMAAGTFKASASPQVDGYRLYLPELVMAAQAWVLGTAGLSELGATTQLG